MSANKRKVTVNGFTKRNIKDVGNCKFWGSGQI
jgi:hypothetical protein